MKKNALLLSIILFFCCMAFRQPDFQEKPETLISGDWQYQIVKETVTITGYTGNSSVVEIPADFDTIPVTTIGAYVFRNHSELSQVTLPDSVLVIGTAAFSGCTSLKIVMLPAGLTQIGNEAFRYCTALESIEFPQTLLTIVNAAFEGCSLLNNLLIPDSVTNVGTNAFKDCSALSSLTISKNLKTMGQDAFAGTPWMAAQTDEFVMVGNKILIQYNGSAAVVEVPTTVTNIVGAFFDNQTLEEIILPDTLTTIGESAFSGCINLKTVIIPQTVTSIGGYAFNNCRSLKAIELPEKLISIGAGAFQSCANLKNVQIPVGTKTINALEFADCFGLESVSIPLTVETIQPTAFQNSLSVNLKVVYGTPGEEFAKTNSIPYTLLEQNSADFAYLRDEKGVELVRYIGQIYDVTIPETLDGAPVWKVAAGAFQENAFVRNVSLPETVKEIGDWAFAYVDGLTSVRISDGTTKIGANAFTGNSNLQELFIPVSVTEIGMDAFRDCPNLIIHTITDSYAWTEAARLGIKTNDPLKVSGDFQLQEADGSYVLVGYSGVEKDITLLSGVLGSKINKVGDNLFSYSSMQEVRIPEGYETIGNLAFAYILNPVTVFLPDSLKEIAANAFEGTTVTFMAHTGTAAEQFAREHGIKFIVPYE